ncbi:hypothetical protein PYV61_22275 [Roseisolibacter sp. H3M3-2]|nr:hypothetical protein [Roseisolibacter sp. H3M3-2]
MTAVIGKLRTPDGCTPGSVGATFPASPPYVNESVRGPSAVASVPSNR